MATLKERIDLSIGIIAAAEWPVRAWGVWLAVGGVVAVAAWRTLPGSADDADGATDRPVAATLAVTGVVAFVVWIATQVLYFAIRRPTLTEGGSSGLSAVDLASVSLLSGMTAWAAGVAVLRLTRSTTTAGYGRRLGRDVAAGVAGAMVSIPVVALTLEATLWLWSAVGYAHPAQHALLDAMQQAPAAWVRAAGVLSAVLAAPLFEELLFRGCLQNAVRRTTGSATVAILTASLPFTLIHATWTMPPIFVLAVLMGVVYERTRSLWATTVMHALFNGFSVAMSLAGG